MGHDSTVLVSSRTHRAGFAGAAGGIRDEPCARRSGGRQVGTKGWSLRSNQGMVLIGSRRNFLGGGVSRIERCMCSQHRTGDGEQSVGDSPQGAPMGMPAFAEFGIAAAAQIVLVNGGPRPVIDGCAEAAVTRLS